MCHVKCVFVCHLMWVRLPCDVCVRLLCDVCARDAHRGTSLIINCLPLGPYSRPMPRALEWSQGGGGVLMSEVPL